MYRWNLINRYTILRWESESPAIILRNNSNNSSNDINENICIAHENGNKLNPLFMTNRFSQQFEKLLYAIILCREYILFSNVL